MEFNSLSIVYQKPSERFLKENILKHVMAIEKKYYPKTAKTNKKKDEVKAITEGEGEEQKD